MKGEEGATGSSVVGNLKEIALWEAELTLSVRHWTDSPKGHAEVWNGYRCFGAASLVVPACHVEPIALMAAQVGQAMQRMARGSSAFNPGPDQAETRILH